MVIDPQGSYLITGGTGGVGRAVAAWLIDRGARHLVLTSRSGRVPEAIAALRQTSADLRVEQVDVCDPTGMQRLVDGMAAKGRPLRGVLHLAGAMRHEAVDALTDAAVSETLRAKALGAWTLHRITQGLELDFLVLFSSLSSLLPAAQMGAYAAANAFLDSLAQHRRGLGLSALSVNWGPWAGPGMGAAQAASSAGSGVALLDPGRALSCLDSLLNADPAQAVVADVDWPVFRQLWGAGQNGLILDGLCPPGPEEAPQDGPQGASPVDLLRAAPAFQRPHLLEHYVRSQVEDVLGIDPRVGIDAGKRLFELGLDSLGGIRLRNRLQADLGHVLPATLTFNYPTVEAIAAYLADTLPALQPARPQEAPEAAPAAAAFARSAEGRAR